MRPPRGRQAQPATIRTKLNLSSGLAPAMIWLNVCSPMLGIAQWLQWALIVGVWVPLGLTFVYLGRFKRESAEAVASGSLPADTADRERKRGRMTLPPMRTTIPRRSRDA